MSTSGKSVVVAGAGNIGSQLVPLLARIAAIGRVTIVDRDVFEAKNLATQAILPSDVGQEKAQALASRVRAIRPDLEVEAITAPLESLPRGVFRADLILACLDSRAARRVLGEIAWRLGVPLLDAGVHGAGLLARVDAYDPGAPEGPCLQCAWSTVDYRALEQSYPCAGAGEHRAPQAPPTNAPAALGALAAALQALECEKWLAGRADRLPSGHQVLIDASSHAHLRSTTRRNIGCRFDHASWDVVQLDDGPDALTLGAALALPGAAASAAASLRVEDQRFVTNLSCATCGPQPGAATPRLVAALTERERRCARCGKEMIPTGFDLMERIDPRTLGEATLASPLRAFGLRPGEVFTIVHAAGVAHYELAGDARRSRAGSSVARATAGAKEPTKEQSMDDVLAGFLEEQLEQGTALAARSTLLELEPLGGPVPDRYVARFACRGLVRAPGGAVVEAEGFSVGIWFPSDYLRAVNPYECVTWLGDVAVQRPFHPNIGPGPGGRTFICVGHLTPGTPLRDILLQCFEIITWQKVTMIEDDALNRDACVWARANLHRLPVDARTMLGRTIPTRAGTSSRIEVTL